MTVAGRDHRKFDSGQEFRARYWTLVVRDFTFVSIVGMGHKREHENTSARLEGVSSLRPAVGATQFSRVRILQSPCQADRSFALRAPLLVAAFIVDYQGLP